MSVNVEFWRCETFAFWVFFQIFCTGRQILVVRTFFCDFDGSKCFWRRLKVPWNAYETLIQLILASGAWSPPQAHLAFRFFTIYRKFCDPSLKKRFPRKDVNTWPATPPQKKWMERTFFKLAHFCFFLQFKLCSKFLRISKIRLYSNLCRCRFSKFTDLKNRGFRKFIYIVGQIFEPPDFWGLWILKICICINSSTIEFSISAEISNKA